MNMPRLLRYSVCVVALVLCCTVLLTSCLKGGVPSETTVAAQSPSDSVTTVLENNTLSSSDLSPEQLNLLRELDEDVDDLLEQLREGDSEDFYEAINRIDDFDSGDMDEGWRNPYEFIENVKIDRTAVTRRVIRKIGEDSASGLGRVDYFIELNVSKSDGKILPMGTSEWVLVYQPNLLSEFKAFCPKDNLKLIDSEVSDSVISFCTDFETEFPALNDKSFTDINNQLVSLKDDIDKQNNVLTSLLRFTLTSGKILENYSYDVYGTPVKYVKQAAKETLGLSESYFDGFDDDYMLSSGFAGGNRLFFTVGSKSYDESSKQHRLTVIYYADIYCFVPTLTVDYTVQVNENGTLCLAEHKCVYTGEYKPARMPD